MEHKEVIIKRHLLGNILLIIVCAIFTVGGILMQQYEEATIRIAGIICIIFFGGGGLLYVVFMAGKPIAVVSGKGIMASYGWGEGFVAWENVDRFEVLEQTVKIKGHKQKIKYIGIFVNDMKGTAGAGEISQAISQKVTGWNESPTLIINLSFSFVKIEKVMGILQEFYDEYRNTQTV